MHFVVNHRGHFILVNRLLEGVLAAPEGRVVVVASRAHHSAPDDGIQFDNLAGEGAFDRQESYGHSKLANGLFARELARRLAGTSATANSLHPGVVVTNISRNLPGWQDAIFRCSILRMRPYSARNNDCSIGRHSIRFSAALTTLRADARSELAAETKTRGMSC